MLGRQDSLAFEDRKSTGAGIHRHGSGEDCSSQDGSRHGRHPAMLDERVSSEWPRQMALSETGSEIKTGELLHQCHGEGRGWRNRHVVLTEKQLVFFKPEASDSGTDVLLYAIPLHTIDSVGRDEQMCISDASDRKLHIFVVRMAENERLFRLRAASADDLESWVEAIQEYVKRDKQRIQFENHRVSAGAQHFLNERRIARELYGSDRAQMFFGFFILLSWLVAIIDAEFQPNASSPEAGALVRNILRVVEALLALVFTVELLLNLFGFWFWPFFRNPWNIFDAVIVCVSFVSLAVEQTPFFGMLRLVRVCKLIRLIKEQVSALHAILIALAVSIVPVLYSFLIVFVVTSLYAVICTKFFGFDHFNHFGTFTRSIFSLYQISTGDSW